MYLQPDYCEGEVSGGKSGVQAVQMKGRQEGKTVGRDKNGLMWFCIMDNEGSACVSLICCWESKEGILVNSRKV